MEDNWTHPESPDYEKIINEYLADGEDGSSEGDEEEAGAKKDEPQEKTTAAKEMQLKDETNTAGPSNWKKRKIRKREREQAKKARAESSSDEFVNTTMADEFKEKCDSSSGKNLILLLSQQFLISPNFKL
jgi:hypothetical protein